MWLPFSQSYCKSSANRGMPLFSCLYPSFGYLQKKFHAKWFKLLIIVPIFGPLLISPPPLPNYHYKTHSRILNRFTDTYWFILCFNHQRLCRNCHGKATMADLDTATLPTRTLFMWQPFWFILHADYTDQNTNNYIHVQYLLDYKNGTRWLTKVVVRCGLLYWWDTSLSKI